MTSKDTHDLDSKTRILAYELWERAGKPDGQNLDFWEHAEQMLLSEAKPDGLSQAQSDVLAA